LRGLPLRAEHRIPKVVPAPPLGPPSNTETRTALGGFGRELTPSSTLRHSPSDERIRLIILLILISTLVFIITILIVPVKKRGINNMINHIN
jgi:hypothetical protein